METTIKRKATFRKLFGEEGIVRYGHKFRRRKAREQRLPGEGLSLDRNSFTRIIYTVEDRVATVTLNKPETLNAMDLEMRRELKQAIEEAAASAEVKALVLTGAGRSFCAGGDIRTMREVKLFEGRERLRTAHEWLSKLIWMDKPTIAAVNGVAAGAGMGLVLACDLVVAAETAKFILSFAMIGLIPDMGTAYFLPRAVGLHRAKEMAFFAEPVDAKSAHAMGFVNKVVPPESVLATAKDMARRLAQGPSRALALAKSLLNRAAQTDLSSVLELEAYAQDLCFGTQDHRGAVEAFLAKRTPQFTGS